MISCGLYNRALRPKHPINIQNMIQEKEKVRDNPFNIRKSSKLEREKILSAAAFQNLQQTNEHKKCVSAWNGVEHESTCNKSLV